MGPAGRCRSALLIGFAFGAVGMAATTWMRSFADFDYVQLALVPMILLSATFFPVDDLPAGAAVAGASCRRSTTASRSSGG